MSGRAMGSHHSARMETDVWLTPPAIVEALGPFDLAPCSPVDRPWDTAAKHYTEEDDGLSYEWEGHVWMNPPYGRQSADVDGAPSQAWGRDRAYPRKDRDGNVFRVRMDPGHGHPVYRGTPALPPPGWNAGQGKLRRTVRPNRLRGQVRGASPDVRH